MVLVGDKGSGRSQLVEAIAMVCGVNPEGASDRVMPHSPPTESQLHVFFTWLTDNPSLGAVDLVSWATTARQ